MRCSRGTLYAVIALLSLLGMVGGCVPSTPSTTPFVLTPPSLIEPENNAVITQNDPTIGCSSIPQRGYGFSIIFNWAGSQASTGIAGYHLYVKNTTAIYPMIDRVVAQPPYISKNCNSFVIDRNLHGWEWRVRAVDGRGSYSEWSETRGFTFAPCRIGDTPCGAH